MPAPSPWLSQYPPNVPAQVPPRHADALTQFREAAADAPDRDALVYFDRHISYAELDRLSDALAVALSRQGFTRGDRLAIYLQNMPHYPIATLAAWKLGGIVVTINPMNREFELAKLLDDARPKVLVCLQSLAATSVARLPQGTHRPALILTVPANQLQNRDDPRIFPSAKVVTPTHGQDLLDFLGSTAGEKPAPLSPAADHAAFIVYTSGTTGLPKGACISHGNVVSVTAAHKAWYALEPGVRILAVAPLFHITGLCGHMTLAWAMAGTLILCHRFEPGVVLDTITEHQPAYTANAITAYIALMNQSGVDANRLKSLTTVTSGGAPVPPSIARQVSETLGWRILNGYGLTETSSGVIIMPRGGENKVDPVSGALSIGIPVSGVSVWVEGEDGGRLGHDEIGELVIEGPMVSPGYWQKPQETAASMRRDGFRTGDIGFMDAAGWFYVVDRKKDMINASGYKVWPREVEDVLYAHPAVREAAVVGIGDAYRGETVKAVVSLRAEQQADRDELIGWCRERLAAYKVPRLIDFVDELPKNASGKILRRVLRDESTGSPA